MTENLKRSSYNVVHNIVRALEESRPPGAEKDPFPLSPGTLNDPTDKNFASRRCTLDKFIVRRWLTLGAKHKRVAMIEKSLSVLICRIRVAPLSWQLAKLSSSLLSFFRRRWLRQDHQVFPPQWTNQVGESWQIPGEYDVSRTPIYHVSGLTGQEGLSNAQTIYRTRSLFESRRNLAVGKPVAYSIGEFCKSLL
jgi:hypothetical protein